MSCIQAYNSWPNNTHGQWLQTQVRRHNSANSRVHCCLLLPPVRKWRRVTHRMTRRGCISSLLPALYWHFWRRQGVFKRLWWLFMLQSCQSLNSINSNNTKLCLGVIAKIGNQKLQIHFYKFPSSQCRTQSSWRPPATCTWPQLMQLVHRCFSNTDAISIKCFHLIMSFI